MENRRYAVLTGDIIQSSRLSAKELETVRGILLDGVEAIRQWDSGLVRGQLEFFRGDSWQLLLTGPRQALRAALYLRARLIAGKLADSRIAIGIGSVGNLDPRAVSRSTGEAFTLSGQALDRMSEPDRLALSPGESAEVDFPLLDLVVQLCGTLVNGWTARQAEVVSLALSPDEPIQETIAAKLDPAVTRQFISKAMIAADWPTLRDAVNRVESLSWKA